MICLKCKTPNPEGAKYCIKCGASLTPEGHKYKCSKCGGVFQGHVTFCPNCGARMKWPGEENPTPVALTPDIKVPSNAVEGSQEYQEVETPVQHSVEENAVDETSQQEVIADETVSPSVNEVVEESSFKEEEQPVQVTNKLFNIIQVVLIGFCVLFALISVLTPAFQISGTSTSLKLFSTYYQNNTVAFSFFDSMFGKADAGKVANVSLPGNIGWLFGNGWENFANMKDYYGSGYSNGSAMTISAILPLIIELLTFIVGLGLIVISGLSALKNALKQLKGQEAKSSLKSTMLVALGALLIQGGIRIGYSQAVYYALNGSKSYELKCSPAVGFYLTIFAVVFAAAAAFIRLFAVAKETKDTKKLLKSIFSAVAIIGISLACLLASGRIFKFTVKYSDPVFSGYSGKETAEFGLMGLFLNICYSYVNEFNGINFGLAIFVVLMLVLYVGIFVATLLNTTSIAKSCDSKGKKPIINIILVGVQLVAIVLIMALTNSLELKVASDNLMFGNGNVNFIQVGPCLIGALIFAIVGLVGTIGNFVFSKKSK